MNAKQKPTVIVVDEETINSPEFQQTCRDIEFTCNAKNHMAKPKLDSSEPKQFDFLGETLEQFLRDA